MAKQSLPAAIIVVAILNFVGAGFSCLCFELTSIFVQIRGGATAVSEPFLGPNHPSIKEMRSMEEHLKKEVPLQTPYTYVSLSASMLLSLTMVLSGIGLLMRQMWGRYLAFMYAIGSILLRLVTTVFMFVFLAPAQASFYAGRTDLPPGVADSQKFTGYFGAAFNLVFFVYPVVVLFLMTRPSVVQALSRNQEPSYE
jgi:hypothetical protein